MTVSTFGSLLVAMISTRLASIATEGIPEALLKDDFLLNDAPTDVTALRDSVRFSGLTKPITLRDMLLLDPNASQQPPVPESNSQVCSNTGGPACQQYNGNMAAAFSALANAAQCGPKRGLYAWSCAECRHVGFDLWPNTMHFITGREILQGHSTSLFVAKVQGSFPGSTPRSSEPLKHAGEECLKNCRVAGYCQWCGVGNACCKQGELLGPRECLGMKGYNSSSEHQCVSSHGPAPTPPSPTPPGPSPTPPSPFPTGAIFTIENVNAPGMYLNVKDNGVEDEATVWLWNNPTFKSSQWRMHPTGSDGIYSIENVNAAGKYLNVQNNGMDNGANVWLYDNPSYTSSQWHVRAAGNSETFVIENVNAAGKYINVKDNSVHDGARVVLWDTPSTTSSQWRINKVAENKSFGAATSSSVDDDSWSPFGCVIAVRGSQNADNWIMNFLFFLVDMHFGEQCPGCRANLGWLTIWHEIESQVMSTLLNLGCVPGGEHGNLLITGHSLGAAVATLAMFHMQAKGYNVVQSFVFESPRVGNTEWSNTFQHFFGRSVPVYRVTHSHDTVPRVPPQLGFLHLDLDFKHVASEVFFPSTNRYDYKVCDTPESIFCGDRYIWLYCLIRDSMSHFASHCQGPFGPHHSWCWCPVRSVADVLDQSSLLV